LTAVHIGSSQWYNVGDILKFNCVNDNPTKPIYELKGALKIECQKSGKWNSKTPRCVGESCMAIYINIVLIEACSLQINRFMNLLANMEFEYW
jgi:hypothetical protein